MRKLLFIGIVSGSVFGLFLKLVQSLTGKQVYTLLLNIDYFPYLKDWDMGEFIEFSLHLFVSIGVVIVLYQVLKRLSNERRIIHYVWINLLIGGFLFLTTSFSVLTPALTDFVALIYWLVGHIVFGFICGIMIHFMFKNKQS